MAGRAACIGKTPSRARLFSIKTVNWSLRRRHTRGHCRRERTRRVSYAQSQTPLKHALKKIWGQATILLMTSKERQPPPTPETTFCPTSTVLAQDRLEKQTSCRQRIST